MNGRWIEGNDIRLLENGEEFFPRVFACIANAKQEVILETFILFEDKVGVQLHQALVAAARRGVLVDMTIDGFGSPDLSEGFMGSLIDAGVRIHVFDPGKRLLGWRMNVLRRMHRKIVVVDAEVAFVGRHQLLGRPPGRLRTGGQAGLCGRDPRPAGGARSIASPAPHWCRASATSAAADGGAGTSACGSIRKTCRGPAARRPCWSCATTPSTRATSSGSTASPSGPHGVA